LVALAWRASRKVGIEVHHDTIGDERVARQLVDLGDGVRTQGSEGVAITG
jgi:hypothetical protein